MLQRYTITEYSNASIEARSVYDDYMRTTGTTGVPIWLRSLGHSAALARAYWERAKGTLFAGTLPLPLKEMIVFIVSARHGARYCSACHAQNVLSLDRAVSFGDLQQMVAPDSGLKLPVYYRAVIEFADKVVADPNALTDDDYEAMMDEGFGKEEICEILAVIDMATMFNVYTSALRLDLDPEYRAIL